jgi:hypothetical protein
MKFLIIIAPIFGSALLYALAIAPRIRFMIDLLAYICLYLALFYPFLFMMYCIITQSS